MKVKNILFTLSTVSYLASVKFAMAADKLEGRIIPRKDGNTDSLQTFLTSIANILLSVVGALALLFIVIGGFQLITSAGNADKVKTAKKTLTYAIIGLLAVALSKVIFGIITGSLLNSIFFTK